MSEMFLDITQALKDAENSIRDFISSILSKELGEDWIVSCGVSQDRLSKWEERKKSEEKRQKFGAVEQRLIYYADFYDLTSILKKNWPGAFSEALGDWKTIEVFLSQLESLRDPDAHRRELLPHQKHLIIGISGEIRTRLVRYRSKQETSEDYYPRIESARDNLGNIITCESPSAQLSTGMTLRPGDLLEFVITATDPMGGVIEYGIYQGCNTKWQDNNVLKFQVKEDHIERNFTLIIVIRSDRKYHAKKDLDDHANFVYEVLPPKSKHL
jgi:hypothetical protein